MYQQIVSLRPEVLETTASKTATKTKVSLDEIELIAAEKLKDNKSAIKNRLREKLLKKREKIDKLLNDNSSN